MPRAAAARLALLAAACAGAHGQSFLLPRWTSEHHDGRNSRRSEFVGPATNGTCIRQALFLNQTCTSPGGCLLPARLSTSGVLSLADSMFIVGDTSDILHIVDDEAYTDTQVDMGVVYSLLNGGARAPSAPYGLAASPLVMPYDDGTGAGTLLSRIIVPSSNGVLFAIDLTSTCVSRLHKEDGVAPVLIGDTPYCPVWSAASPGGGAFLAPPKWSNSGVDYPDGVVLVAESHPSLDQGGILHAFDPFMGSLLWSMPATDSYGTQWGLRTVPAVDGSRNGVIYAAFGGAVYAIWPETGQVLATLDASAWWNQAGGGALDPFVSSPSLASDASGLFVQSALGTLWRINITGTVSLVTFNFTFNGTTAQGTEVNSTIALNVAWACDYYVFDQPCRAPPSAFDVEFNLPKPGTAGKRRAVKRGDIVPGGLYMPSTAEDVAELHAAIKEAAAAKAGLEDSSLLTGSVGQWALDIGHEGVVEVARALGYSRGLNRAGPLGGARLPLGLYPYPTCAVQSVDLGGQVVCNQVPIDEAEYAYNTLRVSDPGTGSEIWSVMDYVDPVTDWFLPFGGGYSSPAVDSAGNVFCAADVPLDWENPAVTTPVLWAFDVNGNLHWTRNMETPLGDGTAKNEYVGYSNVVIGPGALYEHRAYMVASEGLLAFDVGTGCPYGDSPLTPCTGNGVCDCTTGTCTCDSCHLPGPNGDCSVPVDCGGGTCSNGQCVCDACSVFNATSGKCDPRDCGTGTCQITNGTAQCVCSDPCTVVDAQTGKCTAKFDCGHGMCETAGSGTLILRVCKCYPCYSTDLQDKCTIRNTCHAHGSCNPMTGKCSCSSACYKASDNCLAKKNCGYGACDAGSGACDCQDGFAVNVSTGLCSVCDPCHWNSAPGLCRPLGVCGTHGICQVTGSSSYQCNCADGWSGADCSSPSGGSDSPASSGPSPGAVAAGVTIPLLVLGAAAAAFVYYKGGLAAFGIFKYTAVAGSSGSKASKAAAGFATAKAGGAGSETAAQVASRLGSLMSKAAPGGGAGSGSGAAGGERSSLLAAGGKSSTTYGAN